MNAFTPAETLHRLIKQAIDSGAASSIEEAEALFYGYRVCLVIGEAEARRAGDQAALLTALALARRVFLGGVTVAGPLDVRLAVPLPLGDSLRAAVEAIGGQHTANGTVTLSEIACDGRFTSPTTSRHACMADALKARCVLAEVRWRWTLKVL
jgi:hypothetical protein